MRWKQGRRSANIEDRRGGGGRRVPRGMKAGGGATILIVLAALLFGVDPTQLLEQTGGGTTQAPPQSSAPQDEAADFVSVILADTEDTWNAIFPGLGGRYRPPQLVLFTDAVQSACGMNTSATGPFYCPADQKAYLDLGFLRELERFGASGEFAFAYVIAHEVAHHVQNLLGTSQQVHQLQQRSSQRDANALSVLLELQADCYAGVWGHHAARQRNRLEQGDVEDGLQAAASIGDDRMLRMAGRRVNPDAFTHGSSEQRVYWFKRGLETGRVDACDTFSSN